jgi:hypothetical protein
VATKVLRSESFSKSKTTQRDKYNYAIFWVDTLILHIMGKRILLIINQLPIILISHQKTIVMNNYLNFRSIIFTALTALILVAIFSLPGCKSGGGRYHDINLDSVKPHLLPIEAAVKYPARFRAAMDTMGKKYPMYKDSLWFGKAEAFNSDAIAILLQQKDSTQAQAVGIRIYYGLDANKIVRMILVPYDKNGNDIINRLITSEEMQIPGVSSAKAFTTPGGQTIEQGQFCPTVCDNGGGGLGGGNP